jgi:hypothetical protein
MKGVAVVLVVVALVFLAGPALQLRDQGELDPEDKRMKSWQRFLPMRPLETTHMRGPCVRARELVVATGESCRIVIDESWVPRRQAILRFVEGPGLEVGFEPPEATDWKLTNRAPGDTVVLDAYRKGGVLRVRCVRPPAGGGGACLVRVD